MFCTLMLVAPLFLIPLVRASLAPCSYNGIYEDTNDNGAYYRCTNGVQTHHQCPPRTTFDVEELKCTERILKSVRLRRSVKDELKVVCYHVNWGGYRQEEGKFQPEDIDPFLCTHIIYAFAKLDEESYKISESDNGVDIVQKSYERVVNLKKRNPKLRVLLAIGGWTDSEGDKYSKLVRDSDRRKKFVKDVVSFLKQHGFDGLDLDWEFPVCWQADCSKGLTSDKEDFSDFVKELRKAFDDEKPKLLLSAAVSASKYLAKRSYDIKSISKNLDFINVMAYDYYSSANGKTGHHSAFRSSKKNASDHNVVESMKYWEEQGSPKSKLILGIPVYGKTFQLADANQHGIGAISIGKGKKGRYTNDEGTLAYYEILDKLKYKEWKMERDPDAGPYAYGEGQWVSYDDSVSCKQKAKFVKDSGYGGVMIWELSFDDFRGKWSKMKYPILNAFKEAFEGGKISGGTVLKGNYILFISTVLLIVKFYVQF